MSDLLIFDFDGVISNSIHDSYLSAINTYIEFVPGHSLPVPKAIAPPKAIFDFEKEKPGMFEDFLNLIPMGNEAADYYVIFSIMDKGIASEIKTEEDYQAFKDTLPVEVRETFGRLFYSRRVERQKAEGATWSELLPSFPGIPEAIRDLSKKFTLGIATSKDFKSVEIQLASYGLSDLFDPDLILDKDFSYSKRKHIIALQERTGIPFSQIHFIDDKVLHLNATYDPGIRCYLSTWGFNTPREHAIAQQADFTLLSLEGLRELGE